MRQMRLVMDILKLHPYFVACLQLFFQRKCRRIPPKLWHGWCAGHFHRVRASTHCKRTSQNGVLVLTRVVHPARSIIRSKSI